MRDPAKTTRQTTRFATRSIQPTLARSPTIVSTQLLISVSNASEAELVRAAGVDWIDLKDPHAGALGRASLIEARAVAEVLRDHSQRSAALGELNDLDECAALEFAKLFPVVKVGLSGVLNCDSNWKDRFRKLAAALNEHGARLIPVAYADWSICDAPNLQEVLEVAQQVGASHLLIDTFIKDGRGLLDWLNVEELQQIISTARDFNCGVVLAGSLKITDTQQLLALHPAALAVRGAVCRSSSSTIATTQAPLRTAPIELAKVEQWRDAVKS